MISAGVTGFDRVVRVKVNQEVDRPVSAETGREPFDELRTRLHADKSRKELLALSVEDGVWSAQIIETSEGFTLPKLGEQAKDHPQNDSDSACPSASSRKRTRHRHREAR